jgi:hypothetical protein
MTASRFTALAAVFAFGISTFPCSAQTRECSPYAAAIGSGSGHSVTVLPDSLLTNWKSAIACLVPMLKELKDSIKPEIVNAETKSRFLSVTGGIRSIVTRISAGEDRDKTLPADQRDPKLDTIASFVATFQRFQTIDVISVLTFGARSESYDMRLNSVLILGNVLDEKTVCVPLVQLFDPSIDKTAYGINGRANLLSLLSQVAPWAYFEDFRNISRTRAYVSTKVSRDDGNFKGTNAILDNIDKRLLSQTERTNKSVHLPDEFKNACKAYMQSYPPNAEMTAAVSY